MNKIFSFIISLCVVFILYTIAVNITDSLKNKQSIRTLASLVVIIVIVNFVSTINSESNIDFDIDKYDVDYSQVWDNTKSELENAICEQMRLLVMQYGLDVDSIDVSVRTDYQSYSIERITITGVDCNSAKNLIASHFRIDTAYIITDGV